MTNLEERGRVKCHQYWPSEGGEAYGDIQVTLTQTVELSDFTIRTFILKKSNSRAERTLNQYHYTIWPDHGVPSSTTSVLNFVRKASGANPPDAGPMVSPWSMAQKVNPPSSLGDFCRHISSQSFALGYSNYG